MSEEIESLRAEVAALREEVASQRDARANAITRRRLLTGLAGIGAAGAAGVAAAPSAAAAAGDNVVLGQDNISTVPTQLRNDGEDDLPPQPTAGTPVLYVEDASGGAAATFVSSDRAVAASGTFRGGEFFGGTEGVTADSDGIAAMIGQGHDGAIGVAGLSPQGPGLYVEDSLVHAMFKPANAAGPPDFEESPWEAEAGMLHVDSNAVVWLCTEDGPPGTWTRLLREDTAAGRTIPIAPMRALDTRATNGRPPGSPAVPGQKKGPLRGGELFTLDLAGVSPIPAAAAGVVGNLTVVSPTYNGYLVAGPSGTTPTTSALNFTTGATVANAFTSLLGPSGLTLKASGTTTNRYELIVDITAYIT